MSWMRCRGAVGRPVIVLAVAVLAVAAPAGAADGFTPGSPGLGDPFFPLAGNGGYDVTNYALRLGYDPATNHLDGTATIRATATQNLSRFDLDLRGFQISRLLVNGQAASFTRDGQELVITPDAGLPAGQPFTVVVGYAGVPAVITDPDGSIEGWVPTDDGAFVVGEPQGSPGWYPVNDNPQDKATYTFRVTVPEGLTVMANGVLVSQTSTGGETTWLWREGLPMAPNLATATLGRFDVTQDELASGLPVYIAIDPTLSTTSVLKKLPDIVEFYSSIYGPYPLMRSAPSSMTPSKSAIRWRPRPSRCSTAHRMKPPLPMSCRTCGTAISHAAAVARHLAARRVCHLVGVDLERAPGPQVGPPHLQDPLQHAGPGHGLLDTAPAVPGSPEFLFNGTIYDRGAMTLQALREKVGDEDFFRILRDWAAEHRYGNVTTAQFIALAEDDSGLDLDHFFDVWLYQPDKPTSW